MTETLKTKDKLDTETEELPFFTLGELLQQVIPALSPAKPAGTPLPHPSVPAGTPPIQSPAVAASAPKQKPTSQNENDEIKNEKQVID